LNILDFSNMSWMHPTHLLTCLSFDIAR
jgi:hypothetical protein